MDTIKGNITRTFYDCIASAYVIAGLDEYGMPNCVEVRTDVWTTVNPNDKTTAKRLLKAKDKRVVLDTMRIEVIGEQVRSMSLEDFYWRSEPVERKANGRVS